jgi:hypothetical protein
MMKKYFITVDGTEKGPFSFEELADMNLNSSTHVWFKGQERWRPITEVKELIEIINTPPPFKNNKKIDIKELPSETKKEEANESSWILDIIFPFFLWTIICGVITLIVSKIYQFFTGYNYTKYIEEYSNYFWENLERPQALDIPIFWAVGQWVIIIFSIILTYWGMKPAGEKSEK